MACVVLIDLASYVHMALRASGAKWMSPLAEKIMTRLEGAVVGYTCGTILVQWAKGQAEGTGTFVIMESGVFIRINLRRQV